MDSSDSDGSILKKVFKCFSSDCNACFSKKSKLIVHTRKHTGERPFVCDKPNCNKTYTNNSHLRRHKKVSHEGSTSQPVRCEHEGCGAILANKYSLKKHFNRNHNPALYQFKCKDCSQGFHRKKHLQQHIYLHTGEPTFNCDKCDMCFTTSYNLNKHKRSHRVYSCDCGEKFYRWSLFLAHKRSCKKYRFTCKICDKKFSHLGNYRSHQIVHKDDKDKQKFICDYENCGRTYLYEKNLKAHVASFHEKANSETSYRCTHLNCNKVLKTKQCLKQHLERHFEWKKVRVRKERSDKGKPKKSMKEILVGKDLSKVEENIDKSSQIDNLVINNEENKDDTKLDNSFSTSIEESEDTGSDNNSIRSFEESENDVTEDDKSVTSFEESENDITEDDDKSVTSIEENEVDRTHSNNTSVTSVEGSPDNCEENELGFENNLIKHVEEKRVDEIDYDIDLLQQCDKAVAALKEIAQKC